MAAVYFPTALAKRHRRRRTHRSGNNRTVPAVAIAGVAVFAAAGTGAAAKPSAVPAVIHAVTGTSPAAPRPATAPGSMPGTQWLTAGQAAFGRQLVACTGLAPAVVSAWMLAEESGQYAAGRQAGGNNNWLNIGITDSGSYGSADSTWGDPARAATATCGWMTGHATVPGYGPGSPGVQAIARTAGQPAGDQIAAIQSSGWASAGEPALPSCYRQVTGT